MARGPAVLAALAALAAALFGGQLSEDRLPAGAVWVVTGVLLLVARKCWAAKAADAVKAASSDNMRDVTNLILLPKWLFWGILNLSTAFTRMGKALQLPSMRVFDMTMSFTQSRMLHVASQLGVPDILASGPQTAEQIAERVSGPGPVSAARLERILNALIGYGVFQVAVRGGHSFYWNNAVSAVLRSDHPNTMKHMLAHQMSDCYDSWTYLEDMLRGQIEKPWDKSVQAQKLGETGPDNNLWAWYKAFPELEVTFGNAMAAIDLGASAMVADGPFQRVGRVIDVGGNQGNFLRKILLAHPGPSGLLFDLPSVIENARPFWAPGGEFHDLAPRVQLQAGSFLEPESLPAFADDDAIVMRFVLHDWRDEEVVTILTNLRNAVGMRRVALLVGEAAIPDTPFADVFPLRRVIDLQMMCIFDSADRPPATWRRLFERSGWRLAHVHPIRSITHWIEAQPA